MQRKAQLKKLMKGPPLWDVIVIGGGATGLGAAIEATSRGYRTLLLEQADFAKGTSSRSTKLIHGGVRYLPQGQLSLVREALHERGVLLQNAPHLVSSQPFIVPNYKWWEGPFYGIGLKIYDKLAGSLGLGAAQHLSREDILDQIPTIEPKGLRGGVLYYDGQFDDARLAVNLAQTIADLGGTPINYMKMTDLLKSNGEVNGVVARDVEAEQSYKLYGRVVVNATGVFADKILKMDNPEASKMMVLSQGIHIVLNKEFLPGDSALMVPRTSDGRVLFAMPWHNKVIVGTTDTPVDRPRLEPRPLNEEVEFILNNISRYLTRDPKRADINSMFAGLRPLVKADKDKDTSGISRDHAITISESKLVTVVGGKWTTYRKMGAETIDQAVEAAGLPHQDSVTKDIRIHGWMNHTNRDNPLHWYGSDRLAIENMMDKHPELKTKLHEHLPYLEAEVVWAVRNEMARTVEDVLARRTRALLLDAEASVEMAPRVASLMAQELEYGKQWQNRQVKKYKELAARYKI